MTADRGLALRPTETQLVDMAPLMEHVRSFLAPREAEVNRWTIESFDREGFSRRTGFTARRSGKPEVVLAPDVALELGHPSTASRPILLTTERPGFVRPGSVSLVGPDLDRATLGERRPFAQVVMLALRPGSILDPFELDGAQFLINRLPGYMVRVMPGRLWVRVSKHGCAQGLTLRTVSQALTAAFETDFDGVEGIEILFVTSSVADVEMLAPIALAASAISGRHKKLILSEDGEIECSELSCETCDEKPVCDDLREILRERGRK